jgi:hypothetical protein
MFNPKIISVLAQLSTIVAVVVLVHHRGERVRPVRPIGTPQIIATPGKFAIRSSPRGQLVTIETITRKRLYFDASLSIDNSGLMRYVP